MDLQTYHNEIVRNYHVLTLIKNITYTGNMSQTVYYLYPVKCGHLKYTCLVYIWEFLASGQAFMHFCEDLILPFVYFLRHI